MTLPNTIFERVKRARGLQDTVYHIWLVALGCLMTGFARILFDRRVRAP